MIHVVAILETMWDWRGMTSGAGYREAPRFFRINPQNYSGKRLYKLVGPEAKLLVTNACRELVCGPQHHGKGDPAWLRENLTLIETGARLSEWPARRRIDVLLVCGKVAQRTFQSCGYRPTQARIIEMPHPAARSFWTRETITQMSLRIQGD